MLTVHHYLENHVVREFGQRSPNLDLVLSKFIVQVAEKENVLLKEGEFCKSIYFVVSGCLQVFSLDENGKESIREFYLENQWVTDIFGLQNNIPSKEYIKAVEKTTLLVIDLSDFKLLMDNIPPFRMMYQKILEQSYSSTVQRLNTLTAFDAKDKIKWLYEKKPHLLKRVPARLLALYIGMTPETFTRLRSKM